MQALARDIPGHSAGLSGSPAFGRGGRDRRSPARPGRRRLAQRRRRRIPAPAPGLRDGVPGSARAARDPLGPAPQIAVCYVEWSGPESLAVVADWTVVSDDETAGAFAEASLPRSVRSPIAPRSARAIDFARAQFMRSGVESTRRDDRRIGRRHQHQRPRARYLARDEAIAAGITINGLVILSPQPMPWNPSRASAGRARELLPRECRRRPRRVRSGGRRLRRASPMRSPTS